MLDRTYSSFVGERQVTAAGCRRTIQDSRARCVPSAQQIASIARERCSSDVGDHAAAAWGVLPPPPHLRASGRRPAVRPGRSMARRVNRSCYGRAGMAYHPALRRHRAALLQADLPLSRRRPAVPMRRAAHKFARLARAFIFRSIRRNKPDDQRGPDVARNWGCCARCTATCSSPERQDQQKPSAAFQVHAREQLIDLGRAVDICSGAGAAAAPCQSCGSP